MGEGDGDEEAALSGLRRERPDLAETFLAQLPRARAEVLGRLWGALWREDVPAVAGHGYRAASREVTLSLIDGRSLSGPAPAAEMFGDYAAGLAITESPGNRRYWHPAALLASLPLHEPARARLAGELGNSCANLALALTAERDRAFRLRASQDAWTRGRAPLIHEWVGARAQSDPGFRPLPFFEGLVIEGHPVHPCCRTRAGLAVADVLAHAPEWDNLVPISIVAVRSEHHVGAEAAGQTLTALLRGEHPAVAAAAAALPRSERYELLPVHPWQAAQVLPTSFARAIEQGRLRVLPGVTVTAHPLLSYRTLAPAADPRASHLKTALGVHLTSVLRTVSLAAVHDAPRLSSLLTEILRRERWFSGRFRVLAEPATGAFAEGPRESLAALAREAPDGYLEQGEIALPAAALAARSPLSGRVVLGEVVEGFALRRGLSFEAAETAWMTAYCQLLVPATLTLLSRWGVALEAHGQNTLVVLRNGAPVRVLYRNLLGARVSPARLRRLDVEVPPLTAAPIAADEGELRSVLLAALFATQFGELVSALARDCASDPARLWRPVAEACRAVYAALRDDPSVGRQAARDAAVLFSEDLPLEAMLAMRLAPDPNRRLWTSVPNPLAI